jgi:hypothetical protein
MALLVAGALFAASCASSAEQVIGAPSVPAASDSGPAGATTTPGSATSAPSSNTASGDSQAPQGPNEIPQVTVLDVATGDEVALASLAPSDRPILLWMWAPH